MKKRVVVTGGAGFIGSHLVDALLDAGHDVHVIDNYSSGKFDENRNSKACYYELDIRDHEQLLPIIKGADIVYHLAAVASVEKSVKDPLGTHDINVNGLMSVLKAAHIGNAERFVFASSAAVYGSNAVPPVAEHLSLAPESPYGLHKSIGEQYVTLFNSLYGLPTVIVRPFNMYGPRQRGDSPYSGVVSILAERLKAGKPLVLHGKGDQTRDFLYIDDAVRALLLSGEKNEAVGKTINLGSGKGISINELAKTMIQEAGKGKIEYGPSREGDIKHSTADISNAKSYLGWKPLTPLSKGIRSLMRYIGAV